MKNVPEQIFLNLGEITDDEWRELSEKDFSEISKEWEITWCEDRIFKHDIEYVRKDSLNTWRSCRKDPPTKEVTALVFYGTYYGVTTALKHKDGSIRFDPDEEGDEPLAWMPFSALPENIKEMI